MTNTIAAEREIKIKDFVISFYIEGNEEVGFSAWLSQSSPRAEYGWGATIYEAVSSLCHLLMANYEAVMKG